MDIANPVKQLCSEEEEPPAKEDFTAAVKRGRKGMKKEVSSQKENDCVFDPEGSKALESQGDNDDDTVSGLGLVELNKVGKVVPPQRGQLGKGCNGSSEKGNVQTYLVEEEVENKIPQLEIVVNSKNGEIREERNNNLGAGKGKLERLLGPKEKKRKWNRRGKGKRMDVEEGNVEQIKNVLEAVETPGSEDNQRGKEKRMALEAEGNVEVEENVENMETGEEVVQNPPSEGLGKDTQKMDGEKTGNAEGDEKDLGEGKGSDDASTGGSLRKRESSRKALQKMEEMKHKWEEWSEEEEEVGRRKKKRGRKNTKNGGDSVVEEDRSQQARKKRRVRSSSKDEQEKDEKICGTDGESMVEEEMEQVLETKKKKRGRRPTKADENEEQKLDVFF